MHQPESETPERWVLFKRSARELIPAPVYPLFLAILFVSSWWIAYAGVTPINDVDWNRVGQQVRNMWRGETPYCSPWCRFEHDQFDADIPVDDTVWRTQVYSPWVMFYFAPLAYAHVRAILALGVALWIVIVMDSGRPPALILIVHPAFLMLLASANVDFIINGTGLWLIYRGVRGWRRGATLMFILIKPQVLIFVVALEGLRALWERDWEAILTMLGIAGVSIALFPRWLTGTVPGYVGITQGTVEGANVYPFSIVGAWGPLAAIGMTVVVLVLMRHRLTEWRTLAVFMCFVWTPYINPYSYAIVLVLFRKTPAWRSLLYLVLSLATLPFLFNEFHTRERYGVLIFLVLALLLTTPEPDQTEEAIAARTGVPVMPGVDAIRRFQTWRNLRPVTQ